jgi:pathogenesis-related protein 1
MCNYEHNPNLQADYKSAGGTTSAGENIAAGEPTLTIAQANSGWIDEKSIYTYATNTCDTTGMKECGHYTQIVWKTTTSVGCAIVNCTTNSPFGDGRPWTFAVCDYAPAGNIVLNGKLEKPY